MIRRALTPMLLESLSDSPAVFLQGPRQTGKTTLVKALATHRHPARYLTLDDAATLAAARQDPHAFIGDLRGPVIIDEVQRVAELAMAIKASIDQDRTSGRFLLTGSASVFMLPKIADFLAEKKKCLYNSEPELRGLKRITTEQISR